MPSTPTPATTPTARRQNPPHKSYKHIAVIFVVLALLLVLGVTYLALSKVTITLIPSDEKISHNFKLIINQDLPSPTTTDLVLPGKIFSESIKVDQEFFVEEGKQVDAQAQGTVIIHNNRSQSQTLIATTRFLTSNNILFRLKDNVSVPANSTIQAKVYADQLGPAGNVTPTTFTIPGLSESLQKLVYAESTASMAGGTRQIGILTTQDIQRAEEELIKNNSSNLLAKFIDSLEDKNLALVDTQITTQDLSYNKELGEEVDSFTLSTELVVGAVFVQREQILNLAKDKLKESQGPKGEFINVDPSSLKYELTQIDTQQPAAEITVEISGLTSFDPDKDIFDKNLLVGFTEDDIKLYFSQFESIRDTQVEFSPFWVKKVPILKDHIIIQIEK